MPRIFISYRRDDSRTITGRIYDRLVQAFEPDSVFKDVQDIHSGQNWQTVLQQEIERSDIILAVIGATWTTLTDEAGNRRITNDEDYVRLEVAHGLQDAGCTVIPLLVNGADVPEREQLPPDLQPLTERQALRVREDPDFHTDMNILIRDIYRITGTEPVPAADTRASQMPAPPQKRGFQFSGALSGCSFNLAVTLGMFVLVAGLGVALLGEGFLTEPNGRARLTQIAAVSSETAESQPLLTAGAETGNEDSSPTPTSRSVFGQLATRVPATPTATRIIMPPPPEILTPVIQLTDSTCPLEPRLTTGSLAITQPTPTEDGLPLYRLADAESRILMYLPPGKLVNVLEGPVCEDGVYWWLIESTATDEVGWAVEGYDRTYFLAPPD
jgi:hypothetical protein